MPFGLILGALVLWAGYDLMVYGVSQVRGCNVGLRDLSWPGRTIACNPDSGVTAAPNTSPDSPEGNLSTMPPAGPGSVTTPGTQPSSGYAPYIPPSAPATPPPPSGGTSPAGNQGNPSSPPAPY